MADRDPQPLTTAKDWLALAREFLIVAVFVLLLAWPEGFNGLMERAGFTKGSLLGFDWERKVKAASEEAKGAGDAIGQVQTQLKDLSDRLEEMSRAPVTQPQIAAFHREVAGLVKATEKADRATKNSLVTQQKLIAEVAPKAVETTGWIYLGKASGQAWLGGRPETVDDVPLAAVQPGRRLRIRDDTYVRDSDGADPKNLGRVVSVLPSGEQVEVLDARRQPRSGYEAVWARVRRT